MAETKALQVKEKQEISASAEQMSPGLVFTPEVDIFETDLQITLLADMPGVEADGLKIDLQNNVLTITGEVKPWEGADESDVMIEFEIGKYYRRFNLSEVIDQDKIEAKLENGVLRLTLPKADKAVPKRIAVAAA
jgi:HSP20 family protein